MWWEQGARWGITVKPLRGPAKPVIEVLSEGLVSSPCFTGLQVDVSTPGSHPGLKKPPCLGRKDGETQKEKHGIEVMCTCFSRLLLNP